MVWLDLSRIVRISSLQRLSPGAIAGKCSLPLAFTSTPFAISSTAKSLFQITPLFKGVPPRSAFLHSSLVLGPSVKRQFNAGRLEPQRSHRQIPCDLQSRSSRYTPCNWEVTSGWNPSPSNRPCRPPHGRHQ